MTAPPGPVRRCRLLFMSASVKAASASSGAPVQLDERRDRDGLQQRRQGRRQDWLRMASLMREHIGCCRGRVQTIGQGQKPSKQVGMRGTSVTRFRMQQSGKPGCRHPMLLGTICRCGGRPIQGVPANVIFHFNDPLGPARGRGAWRVLPRGGNRRQNHGQAPRPSNGIANAMAGLLARGSSSATDLPGARRDALSVTRVTSGHRWGRLTAYSCGGSLGFAPSRRSLIGFETA